MQRRALADPEPLVREAAAWAIERIERASYNESDPAGEDGP